MCLKLLVCRWEKHRCECASEGSKLRAPKPLPKGAEPYKKSDGPATSFSLPKSGRKFPELIGRLGELSSFLTALGVSSNPYEKAYAGVEVPKDDTRLPELQPFHDLDPDRLQLYGTGSWQIKDFLSDDLIMPFLEPMSIRSGIDLGDRPCIRDSAETVGKLAKIWDAQGLLLLHDERVPHEGLTRIFNAYKGPWVDRQIGDRRGLNSLECKVPGPSSSLPSGVDVSDLYAHPKMQTLAVSITDRRDFYHQISVSRSKAIGNTVGPPVPIHMVSSTSAFKSFTSRGRRKRHNRESDGDAFNKSEDRPGLLVPPPEDHLWVSFDSVLQGDHIGVEVATDGHRNLLQSFDLLDESVCLTADKPLRSSTELQGLCIDDFFCVSVESLSSDQGSSKAKRAYDRAQRAYKTYGLLGSPQKDIISSDSGKTIGALVNSSENARRHNLITVGAPPEKRIGLSSLTLQVCRLSHTTDALHLCLLGAWVSVLSYRRTLLSILRRSFHVVELSKFDRNHPKLIPLSRAVAEELTLLAVLMPFAVFDISAKYMDEIFCTDASTKKGAICSAVCDPKVQEVLWKTGKSKGAYTRLLSPIEVLLQNLGELEHKVSDPAAASPSRPLCYQFDFVEVYAGAALITKNLVELGIPCCPPLDLSYSVEYDVSSHLVMRWLTHLVTTGRIKAFFICPPCTTYSIMRRPPLRDRFQPFGYDPYHPQTRMGNLLAHRALQLMRIGHRRGIAGMLEQPYSSKMQYLPAWKSLVALEDISVVRSDSCQFGSIHQKPFRLVGLRIDMSPLAKRCRCQTKHVKVQGSFTKSSAVYTPLLAATIARCIFSSLCRLKACFAEAMDLDTKGLENQLVNDVAASSTWRVDSSWTFKRESHINILEMCSLLKLASRLALRKQSLRVVNLVDSFVVRGAASKGRSASLGLTPVIRRLCAVSTASFLFFSLPYVPTRLNVSDDPTREREPRPPTPSVIDSNWSSDDLFDLAGIPPTRRWASNWIRLVVRLSAPAVLSLSNESVWPFSPWLSWFRPYRVGGYDFDATLGFPGEGPTVAGPFTFLMFGFCLWISLDFSVCWFGSVLCWISLCGPGCWGAVLAFSFCDHAMAMPLHPGTPAEISRAAVREARGPLPEGRPVLPRTGTQREKFLQIFFNWALERDIDIRYMLDNHYTCIDELNLVLSKFGRVLYHSGKSYNQYAETLNAITSLKPAVRRMLQGAWDLGYAWVREEPGNHHIAMPHQVTLAMISVSLMWGWIRLAGIIALGFAALLRPGELIALVRSDLLLPRDCDAGIGFALVAIREAKTRFSHARLQNAKVDIPDLLQIVDFAFGGLESHQRLWPQSGSTLRQRFKSVLQSLEIANLGRCLDLGSLRAGGATYILQHTENGELLRRRGRWANYKMMEIYVQELASVLYLQTIPPNAKVKIFSAARAFLDVLQRALELRHANIPLQSWFILFSR